MNSTSGPAAVRAIRPHRYQQRDPFFWLAVACSGVIVAFIVVPLVEMMTQPTMAALKETLADRDVVRAIRLSMVTSGAAAMVSLVLGTPLAYLLARRRFAGKKVLESIIDLPIMIPHPVVGIALLSIAGRNHPIGRLMQAAGVTLMGTVSGLIVVLTFVGLPFYINTVKAGFEEISPRLENVSRSLGASAGATFLRVTLPLAWRHMLVGAIMCMARAVSEFGAVVIVAYHPMVAPVMIYERFTAYGLKYSQPVAVWLILVCLLLFLLLRIFSPDREAAV
ncbi:molybdenum ABC transporter permease [Desulfosarcina ovata subsp. sediminis]|uniref:Molybdenum ABC transporter permease n=1 Tax=Desulfosarcina ovata subsp. sediminis TaxID=885957 RepID=A0A5K7ZWR7_9BACT|nr:ABC transporter permease [Desulfosarcina ovata]BBO84668.1 molybdenum ABC transporter permease [Desulfosarcina ovata subsp. sediminis]